MHLGGVQPVRELDPISNGETKGVPYRNKPLAKGATSDMIYRCSPKMKRWTSKTPILLHHGAFQPTPGAFVKKQRPNAGSQRGGGLAVCLNILGLSKMSSSKKDEKVPKDRPPPPPRRRETGERRRDARDERRR